MSAAEVAGGGKARGRIQRMANDLIRYDLRVQDALRGVIRKVLTDAARDGLPGEHHFQVAFRTDAPGVRLSVEMRRRFPQEMTIILQYQFRELSVSDSAVEVVLFFNHVPERLLIPFDAITGFFDPSVDFGLRFDVRGEAVPESGPVLATGPKLVATKAGGGEPARNFPRAAAAAVDSSDAAPARLKPAPARAVDAGKREPGKLSDGKAAKAAEPPVSANKPKVAARDGDGKAGDGKDGDGKIVSIDAFRRKP